MKIGVIGAMEQEVRLLRDALVNRQTTEHAGFRFDEGLLDEVPIVLLLSGIGKVNAALGTALMVERFRPDVLINTGSAGGLDPKMSVGDIVISSALRYHDVDVTAFGYAPGQLPGAPESFLPDADMQKRAQKAVKQVTGRSACLSEILSGDTFMHEPRRIDHVRKLFPDAAALEMEGAAVAHTASRFGLPFVVIRALSDIAGKESKQSFEDFLQLAARQSAQVTRLIVESYKS